MAIDLNDLDYLDDDDFRQQDNEAPIEEPQDVPEDLTEEPSLENDDLTPITPDDVPEEPLDNKDLDTAIMKYLRSMGITDPDKIKFINDDNEIEERTWDSLSEDEKFNILNTEADSSELDLDDDEIDLINRIRLSKMSVGDYISSLNQQAIASALQNDQPLYTVDDLSDEELYVLDLQARIEDISDEELQEALDRAKSNETLFKKEVTGLREDYKRLEDERNLKEQALLLQQQQQLFEQFSNNIINGINSFNSIGSLDIELTDEDKNALYTFITGVDNAGVNHFAKALSDPETIVKTAWFAIHGADVINSIEDYYKQQIAKVAQFNYEKGLKERKEQKVVVRKESLQKKNTKVVKSIDDLD